MSKTSKSQVKAVEKYNKANTVTICIRLNKETDKDILDTLERVDSKQGYVKDLIRKDKRVGGTYRLHRVN